MNSPFSTKTYTDIWLKHFTSDSETKSFSFINGVKFIKNGLLPVYVNVGKNRTNGMLYDFQKDTSDKLGSKVLLIHDVLDYLIENPVKDSSIKIKRARQYQGLFTDLTNITSLDDVLLASFNSKSRSRFRGRIRQIESNFNISHKVYYGHIEKKAYDAYMKILRMLIQKRFEQTKVHNNILPIWEFYTELIYPLILEKKVVFNVVSSDDEPIAISINFVYDGIVAVGVRSFDIQYFKYNIGNYEIVKLLEWCIANNMKSLDFSKGKADYKDRWSNDSYDFECHIIYNSKSLISIIVANYVTLFYRTKQWLRDKEINHLYGRIKFKIKSLLGSKP